MPHKDALERRGLVKTLTLYQWPALLYQVCNAIIEELITFRSGELLNNVSCYNTYTTSTIRLAQTQPLRL